jgi:hypothetical protein
MHLPEVSDFAITLEIMSKQALAVASGAGWGQKTLLKTPVLRVVTI